MNVETMADENGNTKFNGYLKNAQIDWKGKGFFVSAGLVNLKQFSEQENFWGHRYIFKSFQEEYGIAFCEDIGIVAGYEFSPVISADMALTNGEGRKFKNMDNNYKYGAGLTLKPVKGFMFRLYGDIYNTPDAGQGWPQVEVCGSKAGGGYDGGFWKSERSVFNCSLCGVQPQQVFFRCRI